MTQSELLPPDTLTQQLITRRIELVNLLNLKLKAQKNLPEGHLRIEQKKGRRPAQFYHFTNPADTHGAYIPAANHELARRLAQKDYDHKLIKLLQQQISIRLTTLQKLRVVIQNQHRLQSDLIHRQFLQTVFFILQGRFRSILKAGQSKELVSRLRLNRQLKTSAKSLRQQVVIFLKS